MSVKAWDQLGFFESEKVAQSTGKTTDSLEYSRQNRLAIMREYQGELPMSIMKAAKSARTDDPDAIGSYESAANYHSTKRWHDEQDGTTLATAFDVSGQNVRTGALSKFPQNIGRAVTLFYSKEGDRIVDPFAGHNSRMTLCANLGRHYQGYDISQKFMEANHLQAEVLRAKWPSLDIQLHLQDSRKLKYTEDNSADFTITSPPYYNLEDYGDEPEQLGKQRTYQDFLSQLFTVANENYRVLKPKAFAVWFVNDFRRYGRFHSYHVDTINLMERAGFVLWDTMIVDLGYPIRAAFISQAIREQILPKRHEYGLIFRKDTSKEGVIL